MTFSYHLNLEIEIDDLVYEWNLEWLSPTQLRVGDVLDIGDGIDALRVSEVTWFMESPGRAFVAFDDMRANSFEELPGIIFDNITSGYGSPEDSE